MAYEFIKNYCSSFDYFLNIEEVKEKIGKCFDLCSTCGGEWTQCAFEDCTICHIEMKSLCLTCELFGLENPDRKKLFDLRLSKPCLFVGKRKILEDAINASKLNKCQIE